MSGALRLAPGDEESSRDSAGTLGGSREPSQKLWSKEEEVFSALGASLGIRGGPAGQLVFPGAAGRQALTEAVAWMAQARGAGAAIAV